MILKLASVVGSAGLAIAFSICSAQVRANDGTLGEVVNNQLVPLGVTQLGMAGPHGGSIRQCNGVQLETLVTQAGIQLFVYDRSGQPVVVNQGRGAVSLRVAGNAKRYRYELLPSGTGTLTAPVNLSKLAGRQVELDGRLIGIPGAKGQVPFRDVAGIPPSEMQLAAAAIARQKICPVSGKPLGSMGQSVAVEVSGEKVYVCCVSCAESVNADPGKYASGRPEITVSAATAADASLIASQGTCPVMDEPLGSMGQPIKVTVGTKPVFLCCKGCIKKIKSDPAKYLAMVYGDGSSQANSGQVASSVVPAGTEQVRPGVFKVTAADAPFIAAQKICPVMEEPLDAMGGPHKVNAAGKAIYICCPGCAKRISAEPQKYLNMLTKQGVQPPTIQSSKALAVVPAGTDQVRAGVFKVSAADAPFIAAQKICPVMEEPLDAMGGPHKVNAAGRAIYICCPGCAKSIAADPHKYLAILVKRGVQAPAIQTPAALAVVPAGTEEVRAGVFKVTAADSPYIQAQKICPVMEEPLDAMGGPFKVNAAGKAIYICCPGCAKKIVAKPQQYLEALSKKGVEAPMLR
ncbi:MAG: hypothetical protein P1U77_06845 [Rubripirellula sp.]|nr:hypothetical protein [Rubripirellula sp.]